MTTEDDQVTAALIAGELVDRGFAVGVAHDGHEGLAAVCDRPRTSSCVTSACRSCLASPCLSAGPRWCPASATCHSCSSPLGPTARRNSRRGARHRRRCHKTGRFDVLIAIVNARRARAVNERAPRDVTRVKPVKLNERELERLPGPRAERPPPRSRKFLVSLSGPSIATSTMRAASWAPPPGPRPPSRLKTAG